MGRGHSGIRVRLGARRADREGPASGEGGGVRARRAASSWARAAGEGEG